MKSPSHQAALLELYCSRDNTADGSVVVHGNGTPFLPPIQNPTPSATPPPPTHQSSSVFGTKRFTNPSHISNDIRNAQKKVSPSGSTGSRKKIGSDYHFIPMMGKKSQRYQRSSSDSDGDDGCGDNTIDARDLLNDESSKMNGGIEDCSNNSSDHDILRDIFTSSASSNSGSGTKSKERRIDKRYMEYEGGSAHAVSNMTGPLHLEKNGGGINTNTCDYIGLRQSNVEDQPFTSRLGQRIWRRYRDQLRVQSEGEGVRSNRPKDINPFSISSLLPLPPDLLRLPPSIIQIRCPSSSNRIEWATIKELERRAMQNHTMMDVEDTACTSMTGKHDASSFPTSECFTRVIELDPFVGLGMTLRVCDGCTYIHELLRRDGSRLEEGGNIHVDDAGPAYVAGLKPGDRLLGLNGQRFRTVRLATNDDAVLENIGRIDLPQAQVSPDELLKSIGDAIHNSISPMALHIQRLPAARRKRIATLLAQESRSEKEFATKVNSGLTPNPTKPLHAPVKTIHQANPNTITSPRGSIIHPFARALSERSIIKKGQDEVLVTKQLRIFTDRTRQWESKLSFRLRSSDYALRPVLDARDVEYSYYASFLTDDGECPPFFDYKLSKSIRSYAPSTPLIQDWRLSHPDGFMISPAARVSRRLPKETAIMADLYAGLDDDDADMQDILLGGMHNAANSDGATYPTSMSRAIYDRTDIFVPLMGVRKALCVRLLNSFLDNRNRTAFSIWCYDIESGREWYAPVRYYNDFKDLRAALIHVDKTIADIPFPSLGGWNLSFSSEAKESAKTKDARRNQLEMFLRRVFACVYRGRLHPFLAEVAVHLQTFVGCDTVLGEDGEFSLSKQVAISESSYGKRTPDPKSEPGNNARMHLKRSIMRYVYRLFLLPSVEALVSSFVNAVGGKFMSEVPTTRHPPQFSVDKAEASNDVGKIRDFIDQMQELILEGCRDDFISITERREFSALVVDDDNSIRDDLFREAVREQIELEIYVPLRSTISKYLVYAFFNEDMEMKHKMNVSLCHLASPF